MTGMKAAEKYVELTALFWYVKYPVQLFVLVSNNTLVQQGTERGCLHVCSPAKTTLQSVVK